MGGLLLGGGAIFQHNEREHLAPAETAESSELSWPGQLWPAAREPRGASVQGRSYTKSFKALSLIL